MSAPDPLRFPLTPWSRTRAQLELAEARATRSETLAAQLERENAQLRDALDACAAIATAGLDIGRAIAAERDPSCPPANPLNAGDAS